ncbi:MAG TPA: CHAT domain-containing protein, partial [Pyrinomonadaceae bacterium]|nr:CHAT domain-containing protein [Pyrinomonadaceae bacterium]
NSEQHLREAVELARELGERGRIAYTLSDFGLTLEREGHEREALAAYEEVVRLVETLTASLSKDVSAEVFSTKRGNRELYERLIHLLIKHGRVADALGYLERAKAKSLVEALAGAEVSANDPALKELIRRVRNASDAVRAVESALTTETARPQALRDLLKIKAAQAQFTRAQADYTAAVAALQHVNPAYASLVAVRSTDLTQLRQALAPGTLLVEYFPTDTTLYIFYLSRAEAPQVRAVAIKHEELAQLVNEYRAAVVVPSKSAAFARSRGLSAEMGTGSEVKQAIRSMQEITGKLYDVLFAPVQTEIDRADTLLVVPAAELYYLPFHALGRAQTDGSISYLIEQKRFAYLAAADAINTVAAGNANARSQASNRQGLLALGNPDGSLPAAAEEVKTLSRIFPQANIYTGADATLARVESKPAQPIPYIHFATHGIINSREPKESYLLLAGTPGRLSVKDLVEDTYGMSFNGTRLVTLSACQTSIGGWDPSAVYSSLSRAFAKAGAPTVVASLWSVNDAATRDMMTVFYKELAAGQSKAEAMRRAQLAVMHDARFTHPFFWAPFIVLGDWR